MTSIGAETPRHPIGERAVVVGAGMAGLLAARVLADWYEHVTIVERDGLPADVRNRGGVPQGRHLHALLARGQQLLEARFPGLTSELIDAGATVGDVLADVRMHLNGHLLRPGPTGMVAISASRGFLEHHVRRRIIELSAIEVKDQCDVTGLVTTDDQRSITGVRFVNRHHGGDPHVLTGDAVVDASGRTSRLPSWLAEIGVDAPAETRTDVGLSYASRPYRLDRERLGGAIAIIHGMTPDRPRTAAVAAFEAGTGMVTLGGIGEDRPPLDPEGFVEFARTVSHDISEVVRSAEPLGDAIPFRFTASVRRHYERHRTLPDALAALGDSFCSLNPIYAQGMTLAALSAESLDTHLRRHGEIRPQLLHRQVAAAVNPAWRIVTGADIAFPTTPGRPNLPQRTLGRYINRLQAAAAHDATLAAAFMRVAGLVDGPTALLKPAVARRVFTRAP